jgi:hypothetical protein
MSPLKVVRVCTFRSACGPSAAFSVNLWLYESRPNIDNFSHDGVRLNPLAFALCAVGAGSIDCRKWASDVFVEALTVGTLFVETLS